jgi:hypothetical protein
MAWYVHSIDQHVIATSYCVPLKGPEGGGRPITESERQKGKEVGGDQWSVRTCVEDA